MVEPPPSAHSRVLAAEAHGAAAITVAIAAAANNGAVIRALMVIIVNPPYCHLRRPPVGYDSRPGFGLIMKTRWVFSRFNGLGPGRGSKRFEKLSSWHVGAAHWRGAFRSVRSQPPMTSR